MIALSTLIDCTRISLNHFLINETIQKISVRQNYENLLKPVSEHKNKNVFFDSFRLVSVFAVFTYHIYIYLLGNRGLPVVSKFIYLID